MRYLTRRAALAGALIATPAAAQPVVSWQTLAPGLEHGRARVSSDIGDRHLHVLRISPEQFRFALLTGAATGKPPRTARVWASEHNLVAATNAAMFLHSGLPVAFAKAAGRVVQPNQTRDRSVFVFDDTQARLLDRSCDTFNPAAHPNALQGIRMVSCDGRNVWSQQERRWSTACLAQDQAGNILFLHARSPLSVHDFIQTIRAFPLNIERAMYLEGGPEATLHAHVGDVEIERFGSYETSFNENDDNDHAWPLPNVLGIVAR